MPVTSDDVANAEQMGSYVNGMQGVGGYTNFTDVMNDRATSLEDLWHPYCVLYTLHSVMAILAFGLSLKAPKALLALQLLSGVSFLVSAITGWPIWGHAPGDFIWNGVFLKWLIVNLTATVPVLIIKGWKISESALNTMGIFVYTILGANIIWTMFMDSGGMIVVYINRVCGCFLVLALLLHCLAVCRHRPRLPIGQVVVKNGFPYGFGTTFPWLVCYTIWNALFIAKITIGGVLQDLLFWLLMAGYKYWDNKHLPVELYFFFARPVQLGTYIGFTECVGLFVPYFTEATALTEHTPLPVNSHSFFLWLAFMNMLLSILCTFWAGQRLVFGLGYFVSRFNQVGGISKGQEELVLNGSDWCFGDEAAVAQYSSDDEGSAYE